jgi:hypothetical protein
MTGGNQIHLVHIRRKETRLLATSPRQLWPFYALSAIRLEFGKTVDWLLKFQTEIGQLKEPGGTSETPTRINFSDLQNSRLTRLTYPQLTLYEGTMKRNGIPARECNSTGCVCAKNNGATNNNSMNARNLESGTINS